MSYQKANILLHNPLVHAELQKVQPGKIIIKYEVT